MARRGQTTAGLQNDEDVENDGTSTRAPAGGVRASGVTRSRAGNLPCLTVSPIKKSQILL